MKPLVLFAFFSLISGKMILFDFTPGSELYNWRIVNDTVMGGRSASSFSLDADGNAVFKGTVSLENNGGFAMVQYRFPRKSPKTHKKVVMRIKGDGKKYQFRLKSDSSDRHSYIAHFETSGEWQTVKIKLSDMYPGFRGRVLDIPNYPKERLEEIAFLIGNKKAESFQLEIDSIYLE